MCNYKIIGARGIYGRISLLISLANRAKGILQHKIDVQVQLLDAVKTLHT